MVLYVGAEKNCFKNKFHLKYKINGRVIHTEFEIKYLVLG